MKIREIREKPEYAVAAFAGEPVWDEVPAAAIACFPWDRSGYRPRAFARLCRVGEDRLRLRMWCDETDPRATFRLPDSPVYQDSCLEFFVRLPGSDEYFNFEMNAYGTLLCQVGPTEPRTFLAQAGLTRPACRPLNDAELPQAGWGVELELPLSLFREAFGLASFRGRELRGNFYKCGDHTAMPHYGCWAPVENPEPAFHRPACFGRLILPR